MKLSEQIKKQGLININELSKRQVVALINLWSWDFVKQQNSSFRDMLKKCYKSTPWHECSPILYLNEESVLTLNHAFYDMTEAEEELVLNAMSNN